MLSWGALAPRFSTQVSPLRVTRRRRSSGPGESRETRRSGVRTASLVVAGMWTSRAPRSRASMSGAGPEVLLPGVRWSPLVAQTWTVPPRWRRTSAVWSLAVTVVLPTRRTRPLVTSRAPLTVASWEATLPSGCWAEAQVSAATESKVVRISRCFIATPPCGCRGYMLRKFWMICLP
jgi:hypothetical protein